MTNEELDNMFFNYYIPKIKTDLKSNDVHIQISLKTNKKDTKLSLKIISNDNLEISEVFFLLFFKKTAKGKYRFYFNSLKRSNKEKVINMLEEFIIENS